MTSSLEVSDGPAIFSSTTLFNPFRVLYSPCKSTPTHLSGGQKQRIAVAGVLAIKPDVLILDESTSMLDPKGREEVMSVVRKLNDEGMAVIHITHYMDEVLGADRVIVLDGGKIVTEGTPEETFKQGELLRSVGLDVPYPQKLLDELDGVIDAKTAFTKEELLEEIKRAIK